MKNAPKKIKTYKWDPARHLKNDKDRVAYLAVALEDGDPGVVAAVLGDIARSKGMARVAKKAGLGRESLYKALSKDGNPKLDTVLKLTQAFGFKLGVSLGKHEQARAA
ncbi:MAG TPA: addiction module antidote protein [Rhizomicrobium sp.]|jgi:probable addiction module antidote protein|nr:addiction module antidote protein [Rhizomicrobium sp.]